MARLERLVMIACSVAGSLMSSATALAQDKPYSVTTAPQYARVPAATPVVSVVLTLDSSTYFVPRVAGGSVPAVFAWDSPTWYMSTANDTTCAFSQYSTTTLGAQSGAQATVCTTGAASGQCIGEPGSAREKVERFPALASMREESHVFTGLYCQATVTGMGGEAVYPPCVNSSTCSTLFGLPSGTACNATNQSRGGALLVCRTANAGAVVHVGTRR